MQQPLLIPIQESYFLFRILNGSLQAIDSLKDQLCICFTHFFYSKSPLDFIDLRGAHVDQNEKDISGCEEEPNGAVFSALDGILKASLDRLKTMRGSISLGHSGNSDSILGVKFNSDLTMIRALCVEGKLRTALWLWRTMVQQLIIPDVLTHNYLLNALCKSGDIVAAEWLLKKMSCHGLSPTCATYNTIMNGYCLLNEVDKALDLFSAMASHGVRPNRVSCNILVHALCQKGLLDNARNLLEKILEGTYKEQTSDLITSTIFMDRHFKDGNVVEALTYWNDVFNKDSGIQLHDEMLMRGCNPDIVTYTILVKYYCLQNKVKEAQELFFKVQRSGLPVDHVPYLVLMKKLFKMKEIDKVFDLYLMWLRRGTLEA